MILKSDYDPGIISNQLIIIGNGFDLAHGLKTSYNDFILDYFKEIFLEYFEKKRNSILNIYEDKLFSIFIEDSLINKVESEIKEVDWVGDIKTIVDKNKELRIRGLTAFSTKLFNSIDSWVDIENIYYQELKRYLRNEPNSSRGGKDNRPVLFKKLNEQIHFLKVKLQEYLNKQYKKNKILHKIPSKFFLENIYKKMNSDFSRDANLYFLNFNYTHTTDRYYNNNSLSTSMIQINHIHGELYKDNNPIIFGFGDEKDKAYQEIEDLDINEAFKFIKSFGYFHAPNYKKLLAYIDSGKFDVSIMGHSCGLSDRTMLSTIFEHKYCNSIRICYYRKQSEHDDRKDYIEKTYNISRLFDDKAEFRKRILDFNESDRIPQWDDKP